MRYKFFWIEISNGFQKSKTNTMPETKFHFIESRIMDEFIAYLIKNLVDNPGAVEVQVVDNAEDSVVTVKVSEADIAKVVGRQGRIIKSLRTIALTVGARFGRRIRVELVQ